MEDKKTQKSYIVTIPGAGGSQVWGEEKLERNRDQLYKDHPDVSVLETTAYDRDAYKENNNDSFLVTIPGAGGSQLWDHDKFQRNRDKLYGDHPDVNVQTARPYSYGQVADNDMEGAPQAATDYDGIMAEISAFDQDNADFMTDYQQKMKDFHDMQAHAYSPTTGGYFPVRSKKEKELEAYLRDNRENYDALAAQYDDLQRRKYEAGDYRKEVKAISGQIDAMKDNLTKERLALREQENDKAMEQRKGMNFMQILGQTQVPYPVRTEDDQNYQAAYSMLEDAKKTANAPSSSKYGGEGAVKDFFKGASDTLSDYDFWTLGLTKMQDNFQLRSALKKVQDKLGTLEDITEDDIENILSPSEKALVQAFTINALINGKRHGDLSKSYQAGRSATESLKFMAEFMLTGGVGKAATEGAKAAAVKWLGKKLGTMAPDIASKVVRGVGKAAIGGADKLVRSAVMTAIMPSTGANLSEQLVTLTDEGLLPEASRTFLQTVLDQLIENNSEMMGSELLKPLKALLNKVINILPIKNVHKVLKDIRNTSLYQTMKKGGWDGLPEELAEEWYGNVMRALTGNKEALADFATVDSQLITLGSFIPLTLLGSTASTAQYLADKKMMSNAAKNLRNVLSNAGYSQEQADYLLDYTRDTTPQDFSKKITPIINQLASQTPVESSNLFKAATRYMEAVQHYQTIDGIYNEQEAEQRAQAKDEILQSVKQDFWTTADKGGMTQDEVTTATNDKGEFVYVLSEPDKQGNVAVVYPNGKKGVFSEDKLEISEPQTLDQYLSSYIMQKRQVEDEARMDQEREAKLQEMIQTAVPGTQVNLGTQEEPVMSQVASSNADGVIVMPVDGSEPRRLTWEEYGQMTGNSMDVKDQQTLDEEEAQAMADKKEQEHLENDGPVAEPVAEQPEQVETEQPAEEDDVPKNPSGYVLPLKSDGRVNETALWNDNPAEWAAYNDRRRAEKFGSSDNGADSQQYIQNAIAKLSKVLGSIDKKRQNSSDFDEREELEDQMIATQQRINTLNDVLLSYQQEAEQQAAAELEQEQAEIAQETPVSEQPESEIEQNTPEIEQEEPVVEQPVTSREDEEMAELQRQMEENQAAIKAEADIIAREQNIAPEHALNISRERKKGRENYGEPLQEAYSQDGNATLYIAKYPEATQATISLGNDGVVTRTYDNEGNQGVNYVNLHTPDANLQEFADRIFREHKEQLTLIGKSGTSTPQTIAAEEAKVNTEPTEAQKKAGNYAKGHITLDGRDITIENPKGSVRSGKDANGQEWSVTMNNTYGYFLKTQDIDGDHIDVFIGDNLDSDKIFVVDQLTDDNKFDEHKVMYGFNGMDEARDAYLANYSPGWKGLGNITEVSKDEFYKWMDSSFRKGKPFAEYKSVKGAETVQERPMQADVKVPYDNNSLSIDEAISTLYESGANEEQVSEILESQLNDLQAKLKRVRSTKSKQKVNADIKFVKQLMEANEEIKEKLIDYEPMDEGKISLSSEELEPRTAVELAAYMFDKKGSRKGSGIFLQRDSFMKHLGLGQKEANSYIALFRSKQNGGVTMEQAGEQLQYIDREELGTNILDQDDPNSGLNAILDLFGSIERYGDISRFIRTNRENEKKRELAAMQGEVDNWFDDQFGMSEGEYMEYVNQEYRDMVASALTDEQFDELAQEFNQQYNISEDERKAEDLPEGREEPVAEDETGGTESVSPEGNPIQPGAQTREEVATEEEGQPETNGNAGGERTTVSGETPEVKEVYGAKNRVFTLDRYKENRKRMIEKMNQLNAGFDPEILNIGIEMAAFHVEAGAIKFVDFAKRMIADLGDKIKPYLESFYTGAKKMPGMEEYRPYMDTDQFVEQYAANDLKSLTAEDVASPVEEVKEEEAPATADQEEGTVSAVLGKVTPDVNTKTNEEIFVVKPTERTDEEGFKALKKKARDNDGYYSRFKHGFIFKTKEDADAFNSIGETTAPEETGQAPATAEKQEEQPVTEKNGLKVGDKVIFNGRPAVIHSFNELGGVRLDTGNAPLMYENADFSEVRLADKEETEPARKQRTEYAGLKIGDKVIYQGKPAIVHDFREMEVFNQVTLDTGMSPVMYVNAPISELKKAEDQSIEPENIFKSQSDERKTDEQTAAGTVSIGEQADALASEAESLAETGTEEQINEQIEKIDAAIEQVNQQLALLGFYKAEEDDSLFNEMYGYMKTAEKKALKDANSFAKNLALDLDINVGKKKLAKANIAPAGGEITITIPVNDDVELRMYLYLDPKVTDESRDNLELKGIMYRLEFPNNSGMERYGQNWQMKPDVTYGKAVKNVRGLLKQYLSEDKGKSGQPIDLVHVAQKATRDAEKKKNAEKVEEATLFDLFSAPVEDTSEEAPAQENQSVFKPVYETSGQFSSDSGLTYSQEAVNNAKKDLETLVNKLSGDLNAKMQPSFDFREGIDKFQTNSIIYINEGLEAWISVDFVPASKNKGLRWIDETFTDLKLEGNINILLYLPKEEEMMNRYAKVFHLPADSTYDTILDEIQKAIRPYIPKVVEEKAGSKVAITSKSKEKDVSSQTKAEDNGQRKNQNGTMGEGKQQEVEGPSRRPVAESDNGDTTADQDGSGRVAPVHETAGRDEIKAPAVKKNTNNNRVPRGEDSTPKTDSERINANVAAIKLAKELIDNGKKASRADMEVLRKFTGWGGLGSFFNNASSPQYRELASLISDEELYSAEFSVNSGYYTPKDIIDTLWDIAKRLGFKGGKVLEGSAGIGNILGSMPKNLSEASDITAVEKDMLTGSMLELLYPDADIHIEGIEEARIPNNSMDLAITNVPFIADLSVYDKIEKDLTRKFGGNLQDFAIAKNIRKLKEGGIGIFISSKASLDSAKSNTLRHWITNEGKSDVIGAFRLNKDTFIGAPVTTDIIVVRKRVNNVPSPDAIDITNVTNVRNVPIKTGEKYNGKTFSFEDVTQDYPVSYNQYYVEHPESMGGKMYLNGEKGETYRPSSLSLWSEKGIDQKKYFEKWARNLKNQGEKVQQTSTEGPKELEAVENTKEGQLILNSKGALSISRNGKAEPLDINTMKVKGRTKAQVLEDYNGIKTAINNVLDYQEANESDKGLKALLDKLNKSYDEFVKRYGHLNKNTSIAFLRNDVDFPAIAAVENFNETEDQDGKKVVEYEKTDIFKKRMINYKQEPTPKTVKDGVIVSVNKFGRIDVPYIASKLNMDEDKVTNEILESGLGFIDPLDGEVQVRYRYLSGNVREKLAYAKSVNEDGIYDRNIEALEKVIPLDIPAHLIEFSLGSTWIEPILYTMYAQDKLGLNNEFIPINIGGVWKLKSGEESGYRYGQRNEKNRAAGVTSQLVNKTVYGDELMLAAMNNKTIEFSKTQKRYDDTVEKIIDKEASQVASQKMAEMKGDFKEWARKKMLDEDELSERMKKVYNEKFNALVPMTIDDIFLPDKFEGANNSIKLHEHQKRAVIRGTMEPLMLAHEVGTGKTFSLISTAMEMRRLGTAKKPMIVVQNATVGQFVSEAKKLYPNAKVLTVSEKDRTKAGRGAFYAKIKYNNWDLIIVPQSVFEMIPDSEERQKSFIQEKIDEKMHIIEMAEQANADSQTIRSLKQELEDLEYELQTGEKPDKGRKKKGAKEVEKAKESTKAKAEKQLDRRTDDVSDFDDMGIDALLIDEAHEYKHLGFSTSIQRGVKGVDPSFSKKSAGLYLKTRSVFDKSGWKNVVFATGTPISNTAAEIWTFMKYLMPKEVMEANDIYFFDDFVRNFGNISQSLEHATNGKLRENTRFASYVNLPELIRIWSSVTDTVLTKDIGYVNDKIPSVAGGKAQDIFLPQSSTLISIMKMVRAQLEAFEKMSGKEKREHSYIPLVMYGIAKRAAIDTRLVDPKSPDEPLSKTNRTVDEVLKDLKETESYKGTVAIFCDSSNRKDIVDGKKVIGFNIFEDIKKKLVEKGVPASKITIIKSGMDASAKERIFAKVNSGDIRVIMGSTSTLGTGVNIQERLHLLVHMDAPDRPMDYTQRNGRILRQKNLHKQWGKDVKIIRFGVEDSLDVTSYQRLKTKASFIDSVMDGKPLLANSMDNRILEEAEEGLFDNAVAVLSGSEYAILKTQAERELRKYKNKKQQHEQDQIYIENTLDTNERRIANDKRLIEDYKKQLELIKGNFPSGKAKTVTVEGHEAPLSSKEQIDSIFKEFINKKINAEVEKERFNYYSTGKTVMLDFKFDDVKVPVKLQITKTSEWDQVKNQTKFVMHKKVSYTIPALNITDDISSGTDVKDVIDQVQQNVLSGNLAKDRISLYKNAISRMEEDNKVMLERRGKDFAEQAELDAAQAKVNEYTELMKKELAEKEKKYAEMEKDSTVDFKDLNVTDIEDEEEDNTRYRETDEESQSFPDWLMDVEPADNTQNDEVKAHADMETIKARSIMDGTFMKAPNGKPTNLTEKQWLQVRTPAFKAWFGDWENDPENASKVVDENGEPKVVYHGTDSEFTQFDDLKNKWSNAPEGTAWFSSSQEYAGSYTGYETEKKIMPVFLNLRDPYVMDAEGRGVQELTAQYEVYYTDKDGKDTTRYFDFKEDAEEFAKEAGVEDVEINPEGETNANTIVENVMNRGKNDSVIIRNIYDFGEQTDDDMPENPADDYIAFDPNQIKSATDNVGTFSADSNDIRYRVRDEEPPVKTGIGYKVFVVKKDGKLYPPMVANPNGEATPVNVWLNADAAPIVGQTKTGRNQVKAGGKGTQGGSGNLSYRPGWHLGEIPYALQFNRMDENGEKALFPANFVWAEVQYADDVNYQEEAMKYGMNANGKFQHSLAGLPKVPENGSYRYRTNPNPETDPWIITGAMKVNRILTPSEVDAIVREAGREPQKRQPGAITDEQVNKLNETLFNGSDIRYRYIGEQGAERLDKAEEANTRLDNLAVARQMEESGIAPGKIKRATGWERGVDGKWRYETLDFDNVSIYGNIEWLERHPEIKRYRDLYHQSASALFGNGEPLTEEERKELQELNKKYKGIDLNKTQKNKDNLKLTDFISDKELFEAYPELKEVKVSIQPLEENEYGIARMSLNDYYNGNIGDIVISDKLKNSPKFFKTTLVHEIQHKIQYLENFANGGSAKTIRKRLDDLLEDMYSEHEEYKTMLEDMQSAIIYIDWMKKSRKWLANPNSYLKSEDAQKYLGNKDDLIEIGQKHAKDLYWEVTDHLVKMFANYMTDEQVEKFMETFPETAPETNYLTDEAIQILEKAKKELNSNIRSFVKDTRLEEYESLEKKLEEETDYDLYHSLAGEVEARNVEKRLSMTAEQRRESLAKETEDVAWQDQIILYKAYGPSFDEEQMDSQNENRSVFSKRELADRASNAVHTPVTYVRREDLPGNKKAQGYYRGGNVYVCLENCRNAAEAAYTVLHEAVGHKGLRKLIGNENMDQFCMRVFRSATPELRKNILSFAEKKGYKDLIEYSQNIPIAVEEYLASMSEKIEYTKEERSFFDRVKDLFRKLLAKLGVQIRRVSDNDLKWLLWQSYHALDQDDIITSAKRAVIAARYGFDQKSIDEKYDAVMAFREREAGDYLIGSAARQYNNAMRNHTKTLREIYQNQYAPVEELIDAIARQSGKPVEDWENTSMALNHLSSINLEEKKRMIAQHFNPLWDTVGEIMKRTGATEEDINRYVMIKSGLERNEVFAKRDALRTREREYGRRIEEIDDQYNDALKQIAQMDEAEKDDALMKAEKKRTDRIATADAWLDRKKQEIEAGEDPYYLKNRENDYSAIMTWYSRFEEIPERGSDESVEEYLARQRQAMQPMYDTLEEAEEAAQEDVKKFEEMAGELTDSLWKITKETNDAILQHQLNSGMISNDLYDHVSKMMEYYVPLRGFADETAEDLYSYYLTNGGTGFSNPIMAAEGRRTIAESPFGWMATMMESAIQADNKNKAKMSLFYFLSRRKNNDLAKVNRVWYVKEENDKAQEMEDLTGEKQPEYVWKEVYPQLDQARSTTEAQKIAEEFEEDMRELQKEGMARQQFSKLELTRGIVQAGEREKSEHIVTVKINGQKYNILINGNPKAAQAINGFLNVDKEKGADKFYEKVSAVTRYIAMINTSLNPEFMMRNFMRDMGFSFMGISVKEDKDYLGKFMSNWAKSFKVISMIRKHKKGQLGSSYYEKMFEDFTMNGGITGYTRLVSNQEYEKIISRYIKSKDRRESAVAKAAQGVIDGLNSLSEGIENISRFAAFLTSRELGRSIERSVNDGKEVTVNFNTKGSGKSLSWDEVDKMDFKGNSVQVYMQKVLTYVAALPAPLVRSLYVFFNASVQGLANWVGITKKNGPKAMTWIMASVGLGFLNAFIKGMMDDDDDYLTIPDYERRTNLMIGGNGYYFKWALPQEISPFYGFGDIIANMMMGNTYYKNVPKEIMQSFAELLPLNPFTGNGVMRELAPSAVQPFVDVMTNTNYLGSPIYRNMPWDQDDPAYQRVFNGTSPMLISVSEGLNRIGGGDYATVGKLGNGPWMNPSVWEHIFESYTGGIGKFVNRVMKTGRMAIGKDELNFRNIPFINKIFVSNDDRYRNSYVNDVYFYWKRQVDETKSRLSKYKKANDIDKYNELAASPDNMRVKIFKSYSKRIDRYNDMLKAENDYQARKDIMKQLDEVKAELNSRMLEVE